MKETVLGKLFITMGKFCRKLLPLAGSYFLVEVLAAAVLLPEELNGLLFGVLWSFVLAGVAVVLPRLAGRIFFGITYFFSLVWTLAQIGYCSVFDRMMWLSDIFYAGEGAVFIGDVLASFPPLWWIGGILLLALGVFLIIRFPDHGKKLRFRLPGLAISALAVVGLFFVPEYVFLRDLGVWGTRSEYAQSSSYRATYNTMYDAKNVYGICGIYQLTFRDVWKHEIYPLTPAYQAQRQQQTEEIQEYFDVRDDHRENEMTGIYKDKNVVLVLMESMDDWMITPEDTPTICRLMGEGIQFTNFYTPGFGSARTINSEFCVNTGIYLPTTGEYVFDYVTNEFNQSIAFRAKENGYSPEVFHYNTPTFYSRGAFEPAMGYNKYNCYEDYTKDPNALYDDNLLFEIPQLNDLFFRDGKKLNTIITRSAHLSYVYNEVLSHYALKKYPQYRGKYESQEEDCARVKAKLVDDLFARLLQELEQKGQLENTVIIGVTDHYTYGYKNMEELYQHSGVDQKLLLEKTPCFVWSLDGPAISVDKTLNTADFLPTMANLLGFSGEYDYLGQDAFDPNYDGFVIFPDGSWISDGVVCEVTNGSKTSILQNETGKKITEDYLKEMAQKANEFIKISNLLLTSDYYRKD